MFWFLDTLVSLPVVRDTGGDGLSVIDSRARRGDSPPYHVHTTEDENFHVVDGELVLLLEGEDRAARGRRDAARTEGRPAHLPRGLGGGPLARDHGTRRLRALRVRGITPRDGAGASSPVGSADPGAAAGARRARTPPQHRADRARRSQSRWRQRPRHTRPPRSRRRAKPRRRLCPRSPSGSC